MKRIFMFMISSILLICITGCGVDNKTRDSIFNSLQKKKIVDKNFKFFEKIISTHLVIDRSPQKTEINIYKNGNDKYIAIIYEDVHMYKDIKYDYEISIYEAILNENVNYIDKNDIPTTEGHYYYYASNEQFSEDDKYILTLKSYYQVTIKNSILGYKSYKFDLVS